MNPNAYLGHLPAGNPVQRHSAAHWYQRHNLVLVIKIGTNGRKLYQAEKGGRVIASSWFSGDAAIAAATARLESCGIR
jgi:ABC-type nitrate/sulfonate/bicarbonate transport system substrate-binding protein